MKPPMTYERALKIACRAMRIHNTTRLQKCMAIADYPHLRVIKDKSGAYSAATYVLAAASRAHVMPSDWKPDPVRESLLMQYSRGLEAIRMAVEAKEPRTAPGASENCFISWMNYDAGLIRSWCERIQRIDRKRARKLLP